MFVFPGRAFPTESDSSPKWEQVTHTQTCFNQIRWWTDDVILRVIITRLSNIHQLNSQHALFAKLGKYIRCKTKFYQAVYSKDLRILEGADLWTE